MTSSTSLNPVTSDHREETSHAVSSGYSLATFAATPVLLTALVRIIGTVFPVINLWFKPIVLVLCILVAVGLYAQNTVGPDRTNAPRATTFGYLFAFINGIFMFATAVGLDNTTTALLS